MRLMDHLQLERVDLMGYSMGARLSLQTALEHPGPGRQPDRRRHRRADAEAAEGQPPPTMTMAEAMQAEDPETITEKTLKGFRLFADQQGEDRLALAAFSQGRGGLALAEDDLAMLRPPTLVVAGSRDEMAGDPQVLADAIPGAKSVTLPACDHFSAIPHALFKAAVFDFLEGWLE